MAEPLTWRNLSGFQGSSNFDFLNAAKMFTDTGLNGINNGLVTHQKQEGAAFAADQARNYQTLQEALRSQFQTPEALQAAIAGGAVNQMMSPYGDRIDRTKGTNFADALVKDLRTNHIATTTHTNLLNKEAAASPMDDIKAAYASGNFTLGDSLVNQHKGVLDKSDNLAAVSVLRNEGVLSQQNRNTAARTAELSEKNHSTNLTIAETSGLVAKNANSDTKYTTETDAIIDKESDAFQKGETARTQNWVDLGKHRLFNNFPKNSKGLVIVSELNDEQLALYKGFADNAGLLKEGDPSTQNLERIRGTYSYLPQKFQDSINASAAKFSSAPILSANVQAGRAAIKAAYDTKTEEIKKNNPFIFDLDKHTQGASYVATKLNSIQDGDITKYALKENLESLVTKGYEMTDPKTNEVSYLPLPLSMIKAATDYALENSTYLSNDTDNKMKKFLVSQLSSPEVQAQIREAVNHNSGGRKLDYETKINKFDKDNNVDNGSSHASKLIDEVNYRKKANDKKAKSIVDAEIKKKEDAQVAEANARNAKSLDTKHAANSSEAKRSAEKQGVLLEKGAPFFDWMRLNTEDEKRFKAEALEKESNTFRMSADEIQAKENADRLKEFYKRTKN